MAQRKPVTKRNGRTPTMRQRPRVAPDADAHDGNGNGAVEPPVAQDRLPVLKTYKLFVNGQSPRTESGRYYVARAPDGRSLGNICRGSRKDFRDAVVAARAAQSRWASKTAYNR